MIESDATFIPSLREAVGVMPSQEHTLIELSGTDRPVLLSEVCAVLTDLNCNMVNAEIWTHNSRAAAVVHVTDYTTGCAIKDPKKLLLIKKLLCYVLRGNSNCKTVEMTLLTPGTTHRGRRLHQIMFDVRDYEKVERIVQHRVDNAYGRPQIAVSACPEKGYTVITMRSRDRPKLLFDIVCTLTDIQYVIFHGTVTSGRMEAYQFYIRHIDGHSISSEAEREHVMQCLEAAIERGAYEGLELELCTEDRVGLLSDITHIFRENGLSIRRAEIATKSGDAKDTFYVTDVAGNSVDPRILDSIQQQIGQSILHVKHNSYHELKPPQETTISFLFWEFVQVQNLKAFLCGIGTLNKLVQFCAYAKLETPKMCSLAVVEIYQCKESRQVLPNWLRWVFGGKIK